MSASPAPGAVVVDIGSARIKAVAAAQAALAEVRRELASSHAGECAAAMPSSTNAEAPSPAPCVGRQLQPEAMQSDFRETCGWPYSAHTFPRLAKDPS